MSLPDASAARARSRLAAPPRRARQSARRRCCASSRPDRGRALRARARRGRRPAQARYYRDLIPLERPAARPAVRVRGRPRRLHRAARPASPPATASTASTRPRVVAHGRACCTAARAERARPADRDHRVPPLRRSGLPDRLPGRGLREGPGHRHRPAPRRPVHRLPVLHADVPVRCAPSTTRASGIVRKCDMCSEPAGGRRGAGLRAGLPERGHPHPHRGQGRGGAEAAPGRALPARRARADAHRPDHRATRRARPAAAQLAAGRLLQRQPRALAPAARHHAGASPSWRWARSPGAAGAVAAGAAGAVGAGGPGAGRLRAGAGPGRAGRQRLSPGPAAAAPGARCSACAPRG